MNTKRMIFTSLFSAVLCIMSPIALYIGAIPVTLSVFAVFVAALVLPKYDSVTAVILYILIGTIGLPVFSGFKGGLPAIAGATGGFIWSYPLMALIICCFKKYSKLLSLVISLIVCYTAGTLQLSHVAGLTFTASLISGVLPFIPFDLIKLIAALLISKPLQKTCASFYKLS